MIRHLRDTYARRRGGELSFEESGFTLIELLIVIVVLGILAATVIFALSGVTKQSASAACTSDAKTYEVAVSAYENAQSNSGNTTPTTTQQLLNGIGTSGALLHAASNNPAYIVAVSGDNVTGTGTTTGVTNNGAANTSIPAGATAGDIYVGKPGTVLQRYDSESTTNGCNGL
jgi:prepilin-type N-terminal cleavage/methylation domain-containing protein